MNEIDKVVLLARQDELLRIKIEIRDEIDKRLEEIERQLKEPKNES